MHKAGESENLFQEGVCGRRVKIRPRVPKKTVQNDKGLAGGSPVGNVTQEAPARCLAVMSPGCWVEGSWEAQGGSTGTCSSHSVSVGSESRAGHRADVSTGPSAWWSQIRGAGARTLSCYSCTICEGLFSKVSASSSCHAPLLLLLQEFLPSELSAFHTWLSSTLCFTASGWRGP